MSRSLFSLLAVLAFALTSNAATTVSVFPTNSMWGFQRGTNEASVPVSAWRSNDFNAVNFVPSPSPFWYGDVLAGGTQLTDMLNVYSCIFLRREFTVTNSAEIGALQLGALIDDGFVVWVNAVEVLRVNMADQTPNAPITTNTLAVNYPEPVPFLIYNLGASSGYLVAGTNLIAIQVFNISLGSSDLGFNCELQAVLAETNPPVLVTVSPAPGATVTNLTQVAVTFSEEVAGVTADDLVVNGLAATGVTGSGSNYTFTFPQPPYGGLQVSFATNSGIADLAVPPNLFAAAAPSAAWAYTLLDVVPPVVDRVFPAAGVTVRSLAQVEVTFSENVVGVNASDLLVNSQPATNVIVQPGGKFIFQFSQPTPGPVSVAFAALHGITDLGVPPNPFAGGAWSYQLDPNASTGDLIITEILAANTLGLRDPSVTPEDPDPLPWMEIYNRGASPLDLTGWSLTDDPEEPGRWVFPSRVLQPGEYLIVFASGLDIKNPTGTNRFHTNFKLSRVGEFLGLYTPDSPRVLVSGFTMYPEQRNDISYGYDTGGSLRYFNPPTPGAANGGSTIVGVAVPVHFSVPRGHFSTPFNLVLTTPTPGATIRYTTNGSEPTLANGASYSLPLRLTNTVLLRAAAFRNNFLPSRISTHSYLFNLSPAFRSLPIISIVTDQNNLSGPSGIYGISNVTVQADGTFVAAANGYYNTTKHGPAWEKPTSVELIRPEDNSGFQQDAGIRLQGSDYQRPRIQLTDKMSFRLYFRGDYGPGRLDYPMFPLTAAHDFDQIVLRAGFNENNNPFVRDEMTRRLSHDMGEVAAHGSLVVLCLNGQFLTSTRNAGNSPFYNPTERVHEEFFQSYLGGSEEWDVVGPSFATGAGLPGVIDGDRANFQALVNYVRTQPTTNAVVYQTVARWLDLTNFADYCLLNSYAAMGDWPQNNWRAGRERGNTNALWRFIVWDAEWGEGIYERDASSNIFAAFGAGPNGGGLSSTNDSEIAQLHQRLVLNPEFRLLWADRIQKHFFNGGALTGANYTNRLNELRTNLLGFFTMTDADLIGWSQNRLPVIMGQFNTFGLYGLSNATHGLFVSSNAPSFNQHGGRFAPGLMLSMTAPLGGTIYYTVNGDDPRVMFTGVPSPGALEYSTAVPLTQSAIVRARTLRDGTNWSAVTVASFEVGRAGIPLRFTEINYNPPNYNPPGGGAYEFVELMNIGSAPVDLGGLNFSGITFTFLAGASLAPGARLVLAADFDPAAFAARYPGVAVAGYFAGSLNNGGEKISLLDRNGNIITSADYDDESGWATAADGAGYTLEIIDPSGDPDDRANWQASAVLHGTPGAANGTPATSAVRLNEVMAENLTAVNNGGTYPDWVELFNSGADVDLAGWSLSDDGNARKFVFPMNTILTAGGYLVVWCDSVTNTTPGLHAGLPLGRNGDSVFLYDTQTNRRDAITFGLQLPDFTVGRVGGAWQLTTPTPNAANAAVALGSATNLVLNEWMANPLAGQDDTIELFNRSATDPVSLLGLYLGTSNAVQELTSLSFLGPRGYALLRADENVGADHLDFKLPSGPNAIILTDNTGAELQRVNYAAQALGISQGRLPDGTNNVVSFPGSASPGTTNFLNTYAGPVLSEVLARNASAVAADFVELVNPYGTNFPLAGMSLSVDSVEPGQWTFPPSTSIAASSYLIIWCDGARAAQTNSGDYNTGRSLSADSGGVYLFNAAGQAVNTVEYGFQVSNLSIGLSGGQWRLLGVPTPGAANSTNALLATNTVLRLNEWMANPSSGSDWFEIFNSTNKPVDLSGLYLTDDPSTVGQTKFRIAPLNFIGPSGFVQWIADADAGLGRNHVNFDLDSQGESISLLSTNGTNFIDSIVFGAQTLAVSEGRLPDGGSGVSMFPGSATPGESNYRRAEYLVVNELISHTDLPLEDAVEIFNPTSDAVNIGGWYLSNTQLDFKKYRVPDGTSVPANGHLVIYENAFNNGGPASFTFNAAHGDEVWLSAADAFGVLTGVRVGAKFGASFGGVSFGRVVTSVGVDFVATSARSFGVDNPATVVQFRTGTGAANPGPQIGPVMINEIMYHPPDSAPGEPDGEYVELHNFGALAVDLFDAARPTNTWHLADGISFAFPPGVTLAAGGYLLVVNFDAANPTDVAAFRARFGISGSIPVYGPYGGKLDNGGDDVELRAPDAPQPPAAPDAGFVPYVLVDRVKFSDSGPWPGGAVDGGGLSLQRRIPALYGNDPVNWVAASPTPGATNAAGVVPPPTITQSPQSLAILRDGVASFQVAASGVGPLNYQWRFNGTEIPDATNASLVVSYVQLENTGIYDAFVGNAGGTAFSAPASLIVNVPPTIAQGPLAQSPRPGTNIVLSVLAVGTQPLRYQWRRNGLSLAGETNATFFLTIAGLAQTGDYTVSVSNAIGVTNVSAFVNVLVNPLVLSPLTPLNVTAVAGETVTLSVSVTGTLPMGYRWRRGGSTLANIVLNQSTCFFAISNVQPVNAGIYTLVLTNAALPGGIIVTNAILTVLADVDGDRLPDSWETNNMTNPNLNDAALDPDVDGMTNYEEYLAGTNPQDAGSNLRVALSLSGGVFVRFTARANKTYTVLYKDSLSDPNWQKLADVTAQVADHLETISDSSGSLMRYYRVVTPRQP